MPIARTEIATSESKHLESYQCMNLPAENINAGNQIPDQAGSDSPH